MTNTLKKNVLSFFIYLSTDGYIKVQTGELSGLYFLRKEVVILNFGVDVF